MGHRRADGGARFVVELPISRSPENPDAARIDEPGRMDQEAAR